MCVLLGAVTIHFQVSFPISNLCHSQPNLIYTFRLLYSTHPQPVLLVTHTEPLSRSSLSFLLLEITHPLHFRDLPGPSKPHSSQTSPNIAYTSTNYCLLAKRFGKNYYSPSTEPVPEHLCQLLLETFNMPHILALPPLLPALGSLYLPLAAFASFFAASSLKSFAFRVSRSYHEI
ncbi:hypothetical protein FIM1_4700 [Kluyveromyces marxianus]|uniref:Uncharacterized protein n=1 Tax=Kluyveromyces marxianus TaxID=4911 RepID=A0ABX6F4Y2_KLUMA|nr:hypothetical protein FIM1_4700 [Kluyveromyces marxianus]